MPNWSQSPVAYYTGSWSFSFSLPGAALDDQGNLLIAWVDNSFNLNLSYAKPASAILTPVTLNLGAQGSPSVAFANGLFYVFYRTQGGQLQYGTVTPSLTNFTASNFTYKGYLAGANSTDGPQVAVDSSGAIVWVGWRGNGDDQSLYFSSVAEGTWNTNFQQGGVSGLNSAFSPAVGVLKGSGSSYLCTVYCGVSGDPQLYSSDWQLTSTGGFQPDHFVETTSGVLTTTNRPSLVVSPTRDTALMVYQKGPALFSTTASLADLNGAGSPWSSPAPLPNPLKNPVGVLVTQATAISPVYLLVADATNGVISSALNLYEYNWA